MSTPSIESSDCRDVLIHISSHISPVLSKGMVDYIFQYSWPDFAHDPASLEDAIKLLLMAQDIVARSGEDGLVASFPHKRDPLRRREEPITGLRYWRQ